MARNNGEPHPTSAIVVATSHAAALGIAGPGDLTPTVPTDEPVYLIIMHGSFTVYDASPPAGAPLPTGAYLYVVVTRGNFSITDWALGKKSPTIAPSSLGPVATLRFTKATLGRGKLRALSTRLVLSRTTVAAGTPIQGGLVVANDGPSVDEPHGCTPQLAVVLTNSKIPPIGVVPTYCELRQLWIRHGVVRLPLIVSTRYQVCTQTPARATVRVPACLHGGMRTPPFPAGRYKAVAVGEWSNIPKAAPVSVTLRG
jgi:hypothetical protein